MSLNMNWILYGIWFSFRPFFGVIANMFAWLVGLWCLHTTINNISVISWWSAGENHQPVTDKLYHIILHRVHLTMNEIPTHNASGDRHLIAQEIVNPTTIWSRLRHPRTCSLGLRMIHKYTKYNFKNYIALDALIIGYPKQGRQDKRTIIKISMSASNRYSKVDGFKLKLSCLLLF